MNPVEWVANNQWAAWAIAVGLIWAIFSFIGRDD